MRGLRALCLASLALVLCGCTVTRETVLPVIDARHVRLEVDRSGPWLEASLPIEGAPSAGAFQAVRAVQAPSPPRAPEPTEAPPLPVPAARGLGTAAPKGRAPSKPLAQVARERFLDHPTEVEADQATLYLPPALSAEAHLTGAQVAELTPGRRQAVGGARLTCRELTLTAERITLRTQEGSTDLRIAAKGSVRFVSRQGDQVLREQGLRSLLITNDQLTPLR